MILPVLVNGDKIGGEAPDPNHQIPVVFRVLLCVEKNGVVKYVDLCLHTANLKVCFYQRTEFGTTFWRSQRRWMEFHV